MNKSAISIITPFYNQGDVFWETYQSVFAQTFTEWEWVIVDDGSREPASVMLLQELKDRNDARIRVITEEENKGLPAARNAGVKAAAFDFIFFLDSDDLIEPDYLEKALITLLLNPSFCFVNSWSTGFGARCYNWRAGLDKGKLFLEQNWVAFAGLFRKEILEKIPFNEARREGLEDWEFWLASAAAGYWGYTIPERLFHYRIRENSHQKWENWDNGEKQRKIEKEFRKRFSPPLKKGWPRPEKSVYTEGLPVLPVPAVPIPLAPAVVPATSGAIKAGHSNKMRVLVALPWLNQGGVEQFTLNWMKALKDEMEYILVTTNASPENDTDTFTATAGAIFHFAHLGDVTAYPAMIAYLISSRRPDLIVLSHTEHFYHLLPFIQMKFPHIPLTDINHIEDMKWQSGGYPAISARFTDYISSHIVISDWLKTFMIRLGVKGQKLETIYIGADTAAIRPLPREEKADRVSACFSKAAGSAVILFPARLTHQKKALLLPAIAEALIKRNIEAYILVCGDGPDYEALEEAIYQQGLTDYFLLTGAVEHEKVIAYMQTATLLLLPSAWEGIATVLYEAMAAGLPVIATDVGGQRELVTRDAGMLIPLSDDAQLVEAIVSVVQRLIQDEGLRNSIQQNARKRVEAFFDSGMAFAKLAAHFNLVRQGRQALGEREGRQAIGEVVDGLQRKEEELILTDYLHFAAQWNILHQEKKRPGGSNGRIRSAIRRVYKVATGKRPLTYLWKKV